VAYLNFLVEWLTSFHCH